MKLQTQIPLTSKEPQIDYHSKVLLLGSCFTENIGGKLDYFKFQNVQNPFGNIFNPVSIENLIFRALHEHHFSEEEVFLHNGIWHCFEVHSSLSAIKKEVLLNQLNAQLKVLKKELTEASHIIVTLGSAWVYRLNETNEIVANCHKVPQKAFSKELLSPVIISKSLNQIVAEVRNRNPEVIFIFTVSPVRHIKNGFEENALSKAHLLSALHKVNAVAQNTHYFPSYELMMDELRDYRFYKKDMLHPNETAVQYIWERFKKVWITSVTDAIQKEVEHIQNGLKHKPFNPNSEEHKTFKEQLQIKIEELKLQFPFMEFY